MTGAPVRGAATHWLSAAGFGGLDQALKLSTCRRTFERIAEHLHSLTKIDYELHGLSK